MQAVPCVASCCGLAGAVFGHKFRVIEHVSYAGGFDSSDGVYCVRCGTVVLFRDDDDGGDDDDDEIDEEVPDADFGMPLPYGDGLLTT